MFRYILVSTVILVCLDTCWLTLASRLRVYPASAIAHVRPEFGLLAWTSLGCGVAFFCRGAATPLEAARRGFMIGLTGYGVFNGTELALRPDWRSGRLVATDMVWGCFAASLAAVLSRRVMDQSAFSGSFT